MVYKNRETRVQKEGKCNSPIFSTFKLNIALSTTFFLVSPLFTLL